MKKTLLMSCALLALSAGLALAGPGGLNLGWGDCEGLPATGARVFACTSNSGSNILTGSFVAPCCVTAMSANEIVVDLQTSGAALSNWWRIGTGQCRPTSISANISFPATCLDYWALQATIAPPNYTIGVGGANRARIKDLVALPAGNAGITSIDEGTETYSFNMVVNNAKSTGLGACSGCLDGACIVLNSIKLNQVVGTPGGDKFVSLGIRNYVTWQGGSPDCPGATPTQNSTWGSVKALYR